MASTEDSLMMEPNTIPFAAKGKGKAINPVNPDDDTLPWCVSRIELQATTIQRMLGMFQGREVPPRYSGRCRLAQRHHKHE